MSKVTTVVDGRGKKFVVGQQVAKAAKYYQTDGVHCVVCTVTKLNDGKVYLDNSVQPLRFPERVLILSD
jgi:hypothetical protein